MMRADCDVVYPATLAIGGDGGCCTIGAGSCDLAVVAARHNAIAISDRRKNRAGVRLARSCVPTARHEQQRLFAEHEHGRASQKMRVHHCAGSLHRACTLNDRSNVRAAFAHAMQPSNPALILSWGRLRPMKMMRLSRGSLGCQSR